MKSIIAALYAAFLVLVISGCDNEIKNERLARIDSLGTHLNYVRETVSSIDPDLIDKRISELTRTGNWVLDNITDTLAPKPGIRFGDYLRCKKFYDKASTRYDQVNRELQFSEQQLTTLRNDVKNSFYSDEDFEGYFNTESEAIRKLVEATEELNDVYLGVNKQYEFTKPRADQIVDSIKAIIYSPEPI